MPQGLAIATVDVSFPLLAPNGSAAAPSYSFAAATGHGMYADANRVFLAAGGSAGLYTYGSVLSVVAGPLAFSTNEDVILVRDAANVLAQRNGANAQVFRVYETYTDASNYRRLSVSGNGLTLSSLGTGVAASGLYIWNGQAGSVEFATTNTVRWIISASGHFLAATDNTYDIGANGATRPRNIYVSSDITADGTISASTALRASSWGALVVGIHTLQLGGTSFIEWSTTNGNYGVTKDLAISRLGAASLCQGLEPSATPVAQTFTIGEASRPGTDSNVGGANGTIRSGLGTGTGTASYLSFQTPTLAASGTGTQTYTTRLDVASNSIAPYVPVYAIAGSAAAPSYSFAVETTMGMFRAGAEILAFTSNASNNVQFAIQATNIRIASSNTLAWSDSLSADGGTLDTALCRLAAASLRLGSSPSATPVAYTFTIGEASRPGTDTNVGGASGTFRSGLGTGTGTASTLIFQTPDLVASGSSTQTYATRWTVATAGLTATVPYLASAGSIAAPSISFSGDADTGFYNDASNNILKVAIGGARRFYFSDTIFKVDSDSGMVIFGAADDLALARLGAASLRLGYVPSATPIAQTFTIGEFSRVGTDNNVAGSDGTIRSGSGTGNAAGSSLFFDTPTVGASGTVQQSYGHRLTLSALGATFDIPDQGLRINNQVNGAGASAGTLTNAPSAGNPNFWLPISIAGVTRYFPGW